MKTASNTNKYKETGDNSVSLNENQSIKSNQTVAGRTINPFVGLRAFNNDESHLFFGREEHISDVRSKLESNHFVAVVGTSGTGKSSLIRAGVLPSIGRENDNPDLPNWHIVSMKPGNDPLGNLSSAVSQEFEKLDKEKTLTLVKRSPLGLVQSMRGIMGENERLLILVDQFEEVFRFSNDASEDAMAEFNHFVQALVDTMRQRDIPIFLILTLRSDFLGDCVRFQGLPEAINDGHYLVPRMREDQIKRVIADPIAFAEARISPRVIQKVAHEMGNDSDRLPILQHVLMRTFNVWQEEGKSSQPIDVKHLDKTGGIHSALSMHADESFHELSKSQHALAERIFKALTVKAEGSRGVRRPMSLAQLKEVTQASANDVLAALEPFRKAGRSFVLPSLETEVKDATVFDISHESLMRGWDRLKVWTEEEMESASLYVRVCEAALLHKDGAAALWRDPELQLAQDWRTNQNPTESWGKLYHPDFVDGLKFLEKSKHQLEVERSAKKRRAFLLRAAVVVFGLVVSSLSVWALYQSDIATEKSLEAQAKSEEALTEKARAEAEKERAVSATIVAEEAQLTAEEEAARAERQAQLAAEQGRIASLERNKAENSALLAQTEQKKALDQKELADLKTQEALIQKQKADSSRDVAYRLRMIALSENLAYQSAQVTSNPELAALLAIESYEVAKENGGYTNSPTLYASAQGALSKLNPGYTPVVKDLTTNPLAMTVSGKTIGLINGSGNFERLSTDSYEAVLKESKLPAGEELSAAFISPDGSAYALGLKSNTILFSEVQSNKEYTLTGHQGLLRAVVFDAKDGRLITGARDGLVKVWEAGEEIHSHDLGSRIRDFAKFPNSDIILVALENGEVMMFSTKDFSANSFAKREGVRAEVIDMSSDGKVVSVGYSDGLVHLFRSNGNRFGDLPHIGGIKFLISNPSDDLLIVGTSAKSAFIYKLSNPAALPIELRENRPIEGLSYSSISKSLYLATSDKNLKTYPILSSSWIETLKGLVSRELTPEERETFIGDD